MKQIQTEVDDDHCLNVRLSNFLFNLLIVVYVSMGVIVEHLILSLDYV